LSKIILERCNTSVTADRVLSPIPKEGKMPRAEEYPKEVAAAQKVLDDFLAAFNARDIPAFEKTFNFPSIRLASNRLITLNPGDMKPERYTTGALAEWDHSKWDRREVIHAGPDKVHIDTRFTRYRKDGAVIGGFDSVYVITCEDGHWGVKIRSSYAP
jgi:hypothetical protein